DEEVKSFVKYGKHLRKILLPVFEDLQFRLAFRLLPVRSRFWFLQQSNPRIIYCVRNGCDSVETEQHLFFESKKPVVRDEWKECEGVIGDVWHTFRAVTLHFIWSDRNRCLFDGRQPTPTTPAMLVIFTTVD
uniref:Uncharacterized protein n=1 Tax=Globisporangium ultimum (strain ATCC 200006 / CBS 805.95 / DAOM BR144) TaxID=431595 RepID=K3X4F4_GLOUD